MELNRSMVTNRVWIAAAGLALALAAFSYPVWLAAGADPVAPADTSVTASEPSTTEPADKHEAHGLDGSTLSLWWGAPFMGLLLSIALFPLVAPHFWHHHFGKISFLWAIGFLIPNLFHGGLHGTMYEVLHVALLEYFPFIILLLSLFTVAGGVRLTGDLVGTPLVNTGILLLGTALASWMGTTGAAMLLIRPLLRANEWRKRKVHLVVFFIFLVANIGGALTPLGDPPLFLGFLKGVSFFWPTRAMFLPALLLSVLLLAAFFAWDTLMYRTEKSPPRGEGPRQKLGLEGKVNLLLLVGIVGSVLMSGIWKPAFHLPAIMGVHVELQNVVRDVLLLGLAWTSWKLTPISSRRENGFSWFPIVEVAKLFAGIFITIVPVIAILKAGTQGELASLVNMVSRNGAPFNAMYFWMTGVLSSFLDNAPTYLVFFNAAGGDAEKLMAGGTTLLAISAGAVFFGANTYIGNAPNFMVRSIAEEQGVRMPSFFGFMGYSALILLPLFAVVTLIWFRT